MGAVLCLLVSLLPLALPAQAPPTNNCHDPAAWAGWEATVTKHPEDVELQTLHALWMGLCIKVERGDLALEEAMTIFENARGTR
jgi:hypothetical protein